MDDYKHAVAPAIKTELTKMFVTHKALTFINKADIPPDAVFFRFFMFLKLKFLPDHSFERMAARLCAMEATPPPADAETAYAATGDRHLFLLTLNAVLARVVSKADSVTSSSSCDMMPLPPSSNANCLSPTTVACHRALQ